MFLCYSLSSLYRLYRLSIVSLSPLSLSPPSLFLSLSAILSVCLSVCLYLSTSLSLSPSLPLSIFRLSPVTCHLPVTVNNSTLSVGLFLSSLPPSKPRTLHIADLTNKLRLLLSPMLSKNSRTRLSSRQLRQIT